MKNAIQLPFLISVFILSSLSCSTDKIKTNPAYPITRNQELEFEYYFDSENDNSFSPDTIKIKAIESVDINNKLYTVFYNDSNSSLHIHDKETYRIIYNFLPVRYENGNYYQVIDPPLATGESDICILKDGIRKGDGWFFEVVLQEDDMTLIHIFEVSDEIPIYTTGHYIYNNVFKIRQLIQFIDNTNGNVVQEYISYHYYNKEFGIVRKEIPPYLSGTFGLIIFNRII